MGACASCFTSRATPVPNAPHARNTTTHIVDVEESSSYPLTSVEHLPNLMNGLGSSTAPNLSPQFANPSIPSPRNAPSSPGTLPLSSLSPGLDLNGETVDIHHPAPPSSVECTSSFTNQAVNEAATQVAYQHLQNEKSGQTPYAHVSRNGDTAEPTDLRSPITLAPDNESQNALHALAVHLAVEPGVPAPEDERRSTESDQQMAEISTQLDRLAVGSQTAFQSLGNEVERMRGHTAQTRGDVQEAVKYVKETSQHGAHLCS